MSAQRELGRALSGSLRLSEMGEDRDRWGIISDFD